MTGWEQVDDPLLEVTELDVVSWGDDTGLVETSVELDDNLAVAVVIDFLELSDVAWAEVSVVCCEELKVVHHGESENL